MKIALLSTNYDLGGAAVVTKRLCDALRSLGHDARMIVARPSQSDPNSQSSQSPIVVPRLQWLPAFLAERADLWLKGVKRKNIFKVSSGSFGVPIENIPFVKEADAILVNWASQGLLSLGSLERILDLGKPVIYTMHDLWPATAICHLPGTCRRYQQPSPSSQQPSPLQAQAPSPSSQQPSPGSQLPSLGSQLLPPLDGSLSDRGAVSARALPAVCHPCPYLSTKRGAKMIAEVAARKRRIFASPALQLVAVSNWQRSQAQQSRLLPGKEISVIPHPFPIEDYQPGEKLTPDGKRLIVMAAARLDDPVKDLPVAVEALNIFARDYPHLAANVEVAFVGELRDREPLQLMELPYTLHGLLSPDALRQLYARASVVLSSSQYETMGATLMEGMACGAIPVSYGEAGQTDIVDDLKNGFLAPIHTPASLAFALSSAFEVIADPADFPTFTPAELHASVASRFSPREIAQRYLDLIANHR